MFAAGTSCSEMLPSVSVSHSGWQTYPSPTKRVLHAIVSIGVNEVFTVAMYQ